MAEISLGEALQLFLSKSKLKTGIQAVQIKEVWEKLMGITIAKYTDNIQIIGSTLFITTQVALWFIVAVRFLIRLQLLMCLLLLLRWLLAIDIQLDEFRPHGAPILVIQLGEWSKIMPVQCFFRKHRVR